MSGFPGAAPLQGSLLSLFHLPYSISMSRKPLVHRGTLGLRRYCWQAGSYPVETRVGSRASDFEVEYTWSLLEIRDEGSGAA